MDRSLAPRKTLDDLYEEIESGRAKQLILVSHYYRQDPHTYPQSSGTNKLDIVSLEFRHTIPEDRIQKVCEHIKANYWQVIYDVRLITSNRIHIYLVSKPV